MAGFERTVVTDETTFYVHQFKGGGTSHNLYLQNASADTPAYVKIGKDTAAPTAADFDIFLPANMDQPILIPDISVTHITVSYVEEVSIWRYPRVVN